MIAYEKKQTFGHLRDVVTLEMPTFCLPQGVYIRKVHPSRVPDFAHAGQCCLYREGQYYFISRHASTSTMYCDIIYSPSSGLE